MKITLREIIASTIIILLFVTIGILSHSAIKDSYIGENDKYIRALVSEDQETFDFYLATNPGYVFISADIESETIGMDSLNGYLYIKRHKEVYSVSLQTYVDADGNIQTRTVWSWESQGFPESKQVKNIQINGYTVDFDDVETSSFMGTVLQDEIFIDGKEYTRSGKYYKNGNTRYRYVGISLEDMKEVSMFVNFTEPGEMDPGEGSYYVLYDGCIKDLQRHITKSPILWYTMLWFLVLSIGGLAVFAFFHLDNDWLH